MVPFCPTVPFCPNTPCSILPQNLRLGKSNYVNYNIARRSIKLCANANKRYIIIFNHMQRFHYLIYQSTWCQNASKLIYRKGEISFLRNTKNVVYCKFDFHAWRWTGRWQKSSGLENRPTAGMVFPKHPVFHFAPMFHFAPTYYIIVIYTLLAKKVVTPPLKTIKPMWIELLCFHLAEIGMIWTRDCPPTKSDTTLGRHSMQGQVGSSSSETTV